MINQKHANKISKFLSYVLRHKPEAIGLSLDAQGWANIDDLLRLSEIAGTNITLEEVRFVVANDSKGRFALSEDETSIRAVQGHSLQSVDLELTPKAPPKQLLHGTASRFLDSIKDEGLLSKNRQYVHLTDNSETAKSTGMRYGKPVLLEIDSEQMYQNGYVFYQAQNGVWLTKKVPVQYIDFNML